MGVFAILAQYFHAYFHLKTVKEVGEKRAKGKHKLPFLLVFLIGTQKGELKAYEGKCPLLLLS